MLEAENVQHGGIYDGKGEAIWVVGFWKSQADLVFAKVSTRLSASIPKRGGVLCLSLFSSFFQRVHVPILQIYRGSVSFPKTAGYAALPNLQT